MFCNLFERRFCPSWIILVLLASLVSAAPVLAGDMVDIQAPDAVGTGKAFVVRIGTWYPLEDLEVRWNGRSVRPAVTKTGERSEAVVLLGAGLREEPGVRSVEVVARIWGHERRFSRTVEMVPSAWDSEVLTVAPKMVHPPKSARERIKREHETLKAALAKVSPERYWRAPLFRPVKGRMLSRFGLYRTFNGNVAARHTGLDFRAWLGTPIHAVAAGRVALVRALYYGGNSVLIDHGNGFFTMSCHLSATKVKEGDMVKPGQVIGLSGATGRVTGAHLHLAAFVLGAVVDPEPFFAGTVPGELMKGE
ncbi:peptidoglycan DD-metalloendopeptidase family protein [Desulfovibrio sp. Huiquan2017]|uniref:M23 family metallopeptidase n=1 Tax=Desulfovibrio sp. Huiquan2017 TaxID=2816861 RepID=UPI001A9378E9|nr:peptidoglycan DD-metalloendopeptidase family protein [Desulfovibrio sp. Huiquan2017]